MMCARIGMVSGRGLAGAMHHKYPRPLILVAAVALFAANSINVGADLSGMSDAAEMLTRVNSHVFVIVFGVGISVATIFFRYHQIATILKWLALVLFAYVITGFIVHPDWRMVAHAAFIPTWPKSHDQWGMLVAILGTTISPLSVFLAGVAGGRRRQSKRTPNVVSPFRRYAGRDHHAQDRCRRRHVFFESGHVLHHSHDCAHASSTRNHAH